MKNDLQKYLKRLEPVISFSQKYSRFIFFLFIAAIAAFLIFRIDYYVSLKPSEADAADKLQTISRPNIDEAALNRIQQLQDQNVQVQSLIQQARDNPFSE